MQSHTPVVEFNFARQGEIFEQELQIIRRFAAWVDTLGPLDQAGPEVRLQVLAAVRSLARVFKGSGEKASMQDYGRRVLHHAPGSWSLAVITLQPGQKTEPHDHSGWGCAATVQGIERNRRFVRGSRGSLYLISERDYLPGNGYYFHENEIHQPEGADPRQLPVALHFLTEAPAGSQSQAEAGRE